MKKIIMLFVIILSILGLFSCKKDVDPTKDDQITLNEIMVTDKDGNKFEEDKVFAGSTYLHHNVYVKAIYSDESTKDVTSLANFSFVDTSTTGTKNCEVSFQDKKTFYKVIVEEPVPQRLELNIDDVKVLYQIGEYFSKDGLVVKKYFTNGLSTVISDYKITITDSMNRYHSLATVFKNVGNYDVRISSNYLVNQYQICVYDNQLLTEEWSMDSLQSNVVLDENGSYILKENEKILSSKNIELYNSGLATKYETKQPDGQNIVEFYERKTYNSRLLLDTENGLKLEIQKNGYFTFILSSDTEASLIFKDNTQIINPIGNKKDGLRLYYVHLTKGTYDIFSSNGAVYLYGINYAFTDEIVYSSMTLDTSNVKLKYEKNDYFDKKNLVVKVTDENLNESIIDVSLCRIELKLNSNIKTILDEIGVYTVTVSFGGVQASYSIIVEDYTAPLAFQSIEVDASAATTSYYVGDNLDKSKLIIRAKDKKGGVTILSVAVCQFTIKFGNEIVSSFDEAGTYVVIVSCRQSTKTLMDSYQIVVMDKYTSLLVDSSSAKVDYKVGDELDLTGVVVKLVNTRNDQKDIDVLNCFKKLTLNGVEKTSLDEAGTYQVVLSYYKDGQMVAGIYLIHVVQE